MTCFALRVDVAAQLKGPFPKRMIRRHFLACETLEVLVPSFDPSTYQFRHDVKDPVSGAPSLKLETVLKPAEDLMSILLSNMSPGDDKYVVRCNPWLCFLVLRFVHVPVAGGLLHNLKTCLIA